MCGEGVFRIVTDQSGLVNRRLGYDIVVSITYGYTIMNRRHCIGLVVACGAGVATFVAFGMPASRPVSADVPTLGDGDFAALLKAVRPVAGEDLFATIPWETSLWEAREKAAKEGKPILLWEMDGHPLGCG